MPFTEPDPSFGDIIDADWGIEVVESIEALEAAILDEWDSYTVTWNGTINNGTLSGRFIQIGKTVHYKIGLLGGSTTSWPGAQWTFSLPVPGIQPGSPLNDPYIGQLKMFDNSAVLTYPGALAQNGASSSTCHTGASPVGGVTSTSPFTWATNDRLIISGTYEAA